jgi:hypothetical protein
LGTLATNPPWREFAIVGYALFAGLVLIGFGLGTLVRRRWERMRTDDRARRGTEDVDAIATPSESPAGVSVEVLEADDETGRDSSR